MNERITEFIEDQTVATVACIDSEQKPYCFSCFYAFDKEKSLLYFKTSANTNHVQMLNNNKHVAGTIQPDKLNRLAIKGIQFTGTVIDTVEQQSNASALYHKKYPFALAMPGEVWTIQLESIKMTDNTLAFGKKILWSISDPVEV
ncbi:MAG TPA: pyridoxamine 5'-phosphate oxidase family protein [Chitinophagaceae bacterium]